MRATVVVAEDTKDSYAMDQREAAALGRKDPTFDYMDFLLTDPADELCFEATFPTGFESGARG